MTNDPYTLYTLNNGLRVVVEVMPEVRSAAVGFLVLTGARHETPDLAGVSHFLEHMMFKGTAKRTWRDITLDFDRLGSTYNAYTSEDRTMYYGWVRARDLAAQFELLVDMMRSRLPEAEFEMERNVILEEIAMSKDQLEHVAMDFLQEKVFAGHPLAWPVLGYEHTVGKMMRDRMWEYFQQRYAPNSMVLAVAGNVDPGEVVNLAEHHCGAWQAGFDGIETHPPALHKGCDVLVVDRFQQQVLAMTFPSVGAAHPLSETADAAASILGGENSRFYWNIVQAGICPRAGAAHYEYADCGIIMLYAVCRPEHCEAAYAAMQAEARRITTQAVQPHEVERVKNRRRTALAVESEAPYHRLTQMMDDMQYRGAPRTVRQMLAEVDAVSVASIQDYFAQHPIHTGGHLASVGPRHWPENGAIAC